MNPTAEDQGLSPAHVRREVERSLQRLATDWIDLYYMHKPDPDTPADSRQVEKPQWTLPLTADLFTQLGTIEQEANAKGRSLLQHALLALLEQPAVTSLIVGVKRIDQLAALIAAVATT